MIDTVKLVLKMDQPLITKAGFQPSLSSVQPGYRGFFKAFLNPSASTKKLGIYEPRITYVQRPSGLVGIGYELAIELSLPKLIHGNNFNELTESDYPQVIYKLKEFLLAKGIFVFSHQLEDADIRAVHYSKNIIFTDYTSCSSVLHAISLTDVSSIYDVQKTDFRNGGHVFHIHTNSLDIAFYDKLADLSQARISEKRATESDSYPQLSLFKELKEKKPLAVLRYEVRLNGKSMIRDSLSLIGWTGSLTLRDLYSASLSQGILQHHWQKLFGKMPLLNLDTDKPEQLLANILLKPSKKGPRDALAQLGMSMLLNTCDPRLIRKLFEDRFGTHTWNRLKLLRSPPSKQNYRALMHIDESLKEFVPTHLSQIGL